MFFRNRRLVRAVACFFILETIATVVAPTVTWAIMGPSQPEFTSYEAPGATDMVNLSTGDLSYNIPLLDIPGPERSFSLPLNYKAGIQLEQEASWVGLGWSLNAGAIARGVNGYADDADGEPIQVQYQKTLQYGESIAIIPGIAYANWNSNTGWGGSVDLLGLASLNWDKNGLTGGDIIGIGYQKDEGFKLDPVRLVLAVANIATLGGGSVASTAVNIGLQIGSTVGMTLGMSIIGLGRRGGASGYSNYVSTSTNSDFFGSRYYQHVISNSTEYKYGSLYFGHMSQALGTRNTGPNILNNTAAAQAPQFDAHRQTEDDDGLTTSETAADIYQYGDVKADGTAGYYESSRRPVSIAHDYYSVMGAGVSGTIRPDRLEVGSVANGKLGRDEPGKHTKYMVVPYLNNYKVPFRYEGSMSNTYTHHQYSPVGGNNPTGLDVRNSAVALTDPSFSPNGRTETPRKGLNNSILYNQQLVQGKHTVWYTNEEIATMSNFTNGSFDGYSNGFVNFETPQQARVSGVLIPYYDAFRRNLPPKGIGAFAVTAEDGSTYHYSLPVYQFRTFTQSLEKEPFAIEGSRQGRSYILDGSNRMGNFVSRRDAYFVNPNEHGGYATTWLLTAITSPDYIDRNNSGTVDIGDWGGWVQFSYGKYSSRYKWRQPYIGESYADAEPIEYEGHTEGYKETYYLDRISTRTHTALFVKSIRKDGRSHFTAVPIPSYYLSFLSNPVSYPMGIEDTWPCSSLRLDEIVLLDNATLKKLETTNGIQTSNDPNAAVVPAFSNDTNQNSGVEYSCGDAPSRVLDASDLSTDARIQNFIYANALKRIRFNYDYDLCRGTSSSFDYSYANITAVPPMDEARAGVNRLGKLTLKSVSFFGPSVANTPTKITPDFVFGYGTTAADNPSYNREKWDGFGMYCATGAHSTTSHTPTAGSPAAPWTLKQIVSPLGGVTNITYERDEYSRVSEYGAKTIAFDYNGSNVYRLSRTDVGHFTGYLPDFIHQGDRVYLSGDVNFVCRNCTPIGRGSGMSCSNSDKNNKYFRQPCLVTSVTSSTITLTSTSGSGQAISTTCSANTSGGTNTAINIVGKMHIDIPNNTFGGNVRVSAVTTSNIEANEQYQVRYKYVVPGTPITANSSGVIAKDPAFCDRPPRPLDRQFDYPSTPVLYGQVTILRGLFRNNDDNDFTTKEVYGFHTPISNMVTETINAAYPAGISNPNGGSRLYLPEFYNNRVTINTGLIGQPKFVRVYNAQGQQELGTTFNYANNVTNADGMAKQGRFTEGVMTNELLDLTYFRSNRTTKEYIPSVLTSSESTRNGVSISSSNELYDFYTGEVLGTGFTNSRGIKYHSFAVPAYTLPVYASMGAKGDASTNSHMLAQKAATYTVSEVRGGPQYNVRNPLNPQTSNIFSASVQTFQRDWPNYRTVLSSGDYQDDTRPQKPIWREQAAYAWQSPMVNPNGSFANFVAFNWSGTSDNRWVKAGETVRYDHYSHGLENRDVNGQYSASKTGHDESQILASADNAQYTEIAYSGAEDVPTIINGSKHFGGEVVTDGTQADGTQGNPAPHTGRYSARLANGQKLRYQATVSNGVVAGKAYRLSAWVNNANLAGTSGRLYASVNGALVGESSLASADTKKAGQWSRLMLNVTIPSGSAGQLVEFGCRNNSPGDVYFDDFRVCPLNATMTSRVYDPRTNRLTHALDNENLYTRYDYKPDGRLQRVYKEAFDRPGSTAPTARLVKEYEYNYATPRTPNWELISTDCEMADGTNTGNSIRIEENTNSPVPHTRRTVITPSAACPVLDCRPPGVVPASQPPTRREPGTNHCEVAVSAGQICDEYTRGTGSNAVTYSDITYHWTWRDGSNTSTFSSQSGPCADLPLPK